jgi:hypothetical protein
MLYFNAVSLFLFLLAPCFASAENSEELKLLTYQFQLSCNVYDDVGEKAVLTGSLKPSQVSAQSITELLVSFTTSKNNLPSVNAAKAKLSKDSNFSVSADSLIPVESTPGHSHLSYDFHWGYKGSYVVIFRTSCLNCAAIQRHIESTGICYIANIN